MKRIKVESVDHLRSLIESGVHSYVSVYGILRCSKYITMDSDGRFWVFSEVDGSEVEYTDEEMSEIIGKGNFYGETN